MAGAERSLRITDGYRARLTRLTQLAGRLPWTVALTDLDRTGQAWADRTAAQLAVLQGAGARLAAGYLAAFIASETNSLPSIGAVDQTTVGQADDGRPLGEALASAVIAVKVALKQGQPDGDALAFGEQRARLLTATSVTHTPRGALQAGMARDDRVLGWRRVTSGGCGACLAAADNRVREGAMKIHPHCGCTTEPVIASVPDAIRRPTGFQRFHALPPAQQDELLGAEKAELIRSGQVPFERLILPQPMAVSPDGLIEAPLRALT